MTKEKRNPRDEILALKLKECLDMVAPSVEEGLKMREAVDMASEDPLDFARSILEQYGTDALETIIHVFEEVHHEEGSHK